MPPVSAHSLPQPAVGTAAIKPAQRVRRVWRLVSLFLLAVLLLALGRTWLWPHQYHGILLTAAQPTADFALESSAGHTLRLSDLRGRYVLVFFGYTACPDACPLTLANLAQMRTQLGVEQDQVQVLLITVDPARDTPGRLASYLAAFDPTFVGLTGAPEVLQAVASQFGVYFAEAQSTAGVAVDHTSTVTVIDPEGYVRLLFPPTTASADMAADLGYLLTLRSAE